MKNHEKLTSDGGRGPLLKRGARALQSLLKKPAGESTSKNEDLEEMREKLIDANILSSVGGIDMLHKEISGLSGIYRTDGEGIANKLLYYIGIKIGIVGRTVDEEKHYSDSDFFPKGDTTDYAGDDEILRCMYRIGLLSMAGSEEGVKKAAKMEPTHIKGEEYSSQYELDDKTKIIVQKGYEIAEKKVYGVALEKAKKIKPEISLPARKLKKTIEHYRKMANEIRNEKKS